jgi:ferric-dicitrate binding protein FerR (iron transport regulator)
MSDDPRRGAAEDCPKRETLWLLYDGRLRGHEREAAEEHLRRCARCRAGLGESRRIGEAVADLGPGRDDAVRLSARALARYVWRCRVRKVAATAALAAGFVLVVTAAPWFLGREGAAPGPDEEVALTADESPGPADAGEGEPSRAAAPPVQTLACRATARPEDEATEFTVLRNDEAGFEARLEWGSVRFRVPRGVETFRVQTPTHLVQVLGTVFTVAFYNGETHVAVEEGTVEVLALDDREVAVVEPGAPFSSAPPAGVPGVNTPGGPPPRHGTGSTTPPPPDRHLDLPPKWRE